MHLLFSCAKQTQATLPSRKWPYFYKDFFQEFVKKHISFSCLFILLNTIFCRLNKMMLKHGKCFHNFHEFRPTSLESRCWPIFVWVREKWFFLYLNLFFWKINNHTCTNHISLINTLPYICIKYFILSRKKFKVGVHFYWNALYLLDSSSHDNS